MDERERQRKLEAGRAKLASFRQKRAKGDSAGSAKKAQKRKSKNVPQNDSTTEVRGVDAPLSSATDRDLETSMQEEQEPPGEKNQNHGLKNSPPARKVNLSTVKEFGDEELVALTGKEQLKQLQEAVEKRNEIISKLSSNLQEALASRDQVQLEAQSLADQIQALQRQLQQSSVEFLRIKSQAANSVLNVGHQQLNPPNGDQCHENISSTGSEDGDLEESNSDAFLQDLKKKLEIEKLYNQQLSAELENAKASHQQVLSQLEQERKRWETEQKESEMQLEDLQTQCLEIQQYKEEKEKLNQEVLKLRKSLQEEDDADKRFTEERTSYLNSLQTLQEEMEILIEKHKSEMELAKQLLEEKERELKNREDEVMELKDFKNKQNEEKAGFAPEDIEDKDQSRSDEDNMEVSIPKDLLMERYLSCGLVAHSPSSTQGSEQGSQLDSSANYSFELNSEVFEDHLPLASHKEDSDFLCSSPSIPLPVKLDSFSHWVDNSVNDELELSALSEQPIEELDLEKELLNQQCAELRQEITVKDQDLAAMTEKVCKIAEELDSARSRCVQVEDELKGVVLLLEEEKSKRECAEQFVGLATHEEDDDEEVLHNKHVASLEKGNKQNPSSPQDGTMAEELLDLVFLSQQQDVEKASACKEPEPTQRTNDLQTLKDCCGAVHSQLKETTTKYQKTFALLDQRTVDSDAALKDLDTAQDQLLKLQAEVKGLQEELERSQKSLKGAEEQKKELESKMDFLTQNLAKLEEEQTHAILQREEYVKKGEEMEERIRKMEQVLEDELEQFENLLKAKDDEFAEEKEKWEYEKQEKNKELSDLQQILDQQKKEMEKEVTSLLDKQAQTVEQATAELRKSHQLEVECLVEQQQHEMSELNKSLELKLQQQQATLEAEQNKQMSLVKQVTERVHERTMSELVIKQDEEMIRLRSEHSLVLESMEVAHQTELQQAQDQKMLDLEILTKESVEQKNHRAKTQEELEASKTSLGQTTKDLNDAQEILSRTQSKLLAELEKIQKDGENIQDLKQAWADRDAATCTLEELVSGHLAVLQAREQQVCHLKEKEEHLQKEVCRLQAEGVSLKKSSEQEVGQLWTQLESMRASRQELGELKEQLLARSSRVEDIERLKKDFTEKKQEIKEQNEAELEGLRRYFELRLQAAEENHREEIALLQLKLVEGALEESVLRTSDHSSLSEVHVEDERGDLFSENALKPENQQEVLDDLRLQLETSHKMDLEKVQTSMTLSFNDEFDKMRSDLTDHYYGDLQDIKSRHALELEQLRAKLSEHHLKEINQVRLEAARLVEVEVEQRMWSFSEELHTKIEFSHALHGLSALGKRQEKEQMLMEKEHFKEEERGKLREELTCKHEAELDELRRSLTKQMDDQKKCLDQALQEERERLKNLKANLDQTKGPQVEKPNPQLQAEYKTELHHQNRCMVTEIKALTVLLQEQAEERLNQSQKRFEREKVMLEQCLSQKYDISLAELGSKHQAEVEQLRAALLDKYSEEKVMLEDRHKANFDSLGASHRQQLSTTVAELECKHNSQLVSLEATLNSKRKKDLESLEAAFQETTRAQLEVLESVLSCKHQEEKDELEKRMLANMDTLEATYLKEVQTLRDEIINLEQQRCKELELQQTEHQKLTERNLDEQKSVREELRKELAQLHMEKFKAMAAELSQVHKSDLLAQKESLDIEHCNALGILKKQVLELEQQHSASLQELSLSLTAEKQQVMDEHQLRIQELRSVSARELEAWRRELEEESSRQRQHLLEEVELLKAQSEERLHDRINHLKTTFEEKKEAELEDLRRSFTAEQEEKERHYTGKMSQLTAQLQQLDAVVAQLRAEVGCLQGELEGKRAEMETLDTVLQRRERESQEGGNHLKLLTDDLQAAKDERKKLHQANNNLTVVVHEMVRSIVAVEELIGKKLTKRSNAPDLPTNHRSLTGNEDPHESGISVAEMTTEDFELSNVLPESTFVSDTHIFPGSEKEMAMNACRRLHLTVDTLMEQLERTHDFHLSLEEKFSRGRDDTAQLEEQHKILLEQMDQEAKEKSGLHLKLHKTEGLLDGYVAVKAILEETLSQKEAQEERLVEELEELRVKVWQMQGLSAELEDLRVKHQELSEEHTVLLRTKEHLSADLGEREKALLAETERMSLDRLDLQRQAEKDHHSLSQRLSALERELEEQETKGLEADQHHKTRTEDLHQRVHSLEKQLKHNRQFIEEQAVEREHERDEFQHEIRRLEANLRQTTTVDKVHRVENLQATIKDKTEDHAALMTANEQAQLDITERNEEIIKLANRIRELEQALLYSAESSRAAGQLEQKLNKAKMREQELIQDKQALEQQQLANRLQISALQSKLDETRHCYNDGTLDPTLELRDALDSAQQSLQNKEQQVEILTSQMENLQSEFSIKVVEVKHLTLQLELLNDRNAARVNELEEEISVLKENVSALTILTEERDEERRLEDPDEDTFPCALLEEKNQEIDHLTLEVQRLELELETTRDNKALESELAELSSRLEHLTSEISRVRQDKQEEEERLHEVISKLQAELATLGPNLHEVSDSQDGDSINPSPSPSPEPHFYITQEQAGRSGPYNLKHELSLTNSVPSRSLRSRVKTLQAQLETAGAEKEGLERLLLTQEEEYRAQGEEFGKTLTAEKGKVVDLQNILALKEAELGNVASQLEVEKQRRNKSEEELNITRAQAQKALVLQEENNNLNSLLLELQQNEHVRLQEIEALKTQSRETKACQESCLTLEGQVQKLRAELVDMEELVDQERMKAQVVLKAELSAEREVLKRREGQLHEKIERLRQEVISLKAQISSLTVKLNEKETCQGNPKNILAHAEQSRDKAAEHLRRREKELNRLESDHQTLKAELTVVKDQFATAAELADKLQDELHRKDCELANLQTKNQHLKLKLGSLQGQLAQQNEQIEQLKGQFTSPQHPESPQKDSSHRSFRHAVSCDEASLNSPEVLRKMDLSADGVFGHSHSLVVDSRLSGLNSASLCPGLVHNSPKMVLASPHSRTITPDPTTQSSHSPRSVSISNYSVLDSLDADKVTDIGDLTTPSSPIGSTSSLSATEWASDGYGSNVSSELGARLREELEQTERLDAQFVNYLRCRGMNPATNTDSAAGSMSYSDDLLSPELQALLKSVYRESCRILTLSQRPATSSSQAFVSDLGSLSLNHAEACSSFLDHRGDSSNVAPMTWQQEKRALQETVIALRELLCRMAQRRTDNDSRVDVDWNKGLLQAGAQFQVRTELDESQKQLQCSHEMQQEQRCKIQSLRSTIEEEQEALKSAQTRVEHLEQLLEQERVLNHRREREVEHLREAKHESCEQQRSEVMTLKGQVEQGNVACSNLRRELQIEQSRSVLLEKRLVEIQTQMEQERRQAEDLAAENERVRADLQKCNQAFESERERSGLLKVEVKELEKKIRLMKGKEKEWDDNWEKERRRCRQEEIDGEKRQERMNNKLLQLEMLRQQDQQRMQELQQTLEELEKEEKAMAAQRMSQQKSSNSRPFNDLQGGGSLQHSKMSPASSRSLLDTLMKENSELTENVRSLSREKSAFKHKLYLTERQLHRTEIELSKVSMETENIPVNDGANYIKLQRLYGRYLHAESFRKALVYQKRYLLLLLGGFQQCEQATLCIIAKMGARPSTPLPSRHRPLARFRATVQVVIAISRMKFLNRKWHSTIHKISSSLTVNGHSSGSKADVLRQRKSRSNSESPPTKNAVSALVPPSKSPFRLNNRSFATSSVALGQSETSQDPEKSLTDYIRHLERVQRRLSGGSRGDSSVSPSDPKKLDH